MYLNGKHKWQNFGCVIHLFLSLTGMKLHLMEKRRFFFFLEHGVLEIAPY